MKSTIAAIGLAIGLSFATIGIAYASPAYPTTRCSEAKAALVSLQKQADAATGPVKQAFVTMIYGLTPQVNRLCSPTSAPG